MTQAQIDLQTFLEPMEHTKVEHENSKPTPSQADTDHTQSTPPPPKKTI